MSDLGQRIASLKIAAPNGDAVQLGYYSRGYNGAIDDVVGVIQSEKNNVDLALEKLEELRLEAWGFDHTFESSFHCDVFYKIEEIMGLLKGEK